MLGYVRSISEGGHNLIPRELIILLNVFDFISRGKSAKYRCDVDSGSLDAGFPKANFWIHCNARINFH
jgi:hypothetical protein